MVLRRLLSRGFGTTASFNKEVDLVANAYLKQIRDIAAKQKAAGGDILASSPEIKKQFEEQLLRLAAKFQLPNLDSVTKLNLHFTKPDVKSSVDEVTDGRSVDELVAELNASRKQYETKQAEKKKKEQERLAVLDSADNQYAKDFYPIPPPQVVLGTK